MTLMTEAEYAERCNELVADLVELILWEENFDAAERRDQAANNDWCD